MSESDNDSPDLTISENNSPKQEPEIEDSGTESEQSEKSEQDHIAEMLSKKKKRINRGNEDDCDEETENMIDKLIQSMNDAATEDIEANKRGLPALAKLKLLDKVIKFLKVSKHHELFLVMNGCVVLGNWLKQLPDGSFPSNPLRARLLEVIQDLPVSVDNLTNSNLGKSIMAINKNPNENSQIKKLAKTLIDKWSRMIYDIKTEYTELVNSDQYVETASLPKKKISLQNLIDKEMQTSYTRIPEKGLFNFKAKPAPDIKDNEVVQQFASDSTYGRLKKKMMKKKGKSKSKGLMSVDGKGLDY